MTDKDFHRNAIEWFFHACLLALGGAIALVTTLELLGQIWPWLVLIGLLVAAVWVGASRLRSRRQRW